MSLKRSMWIGLVGLNIIVAFLIESVFANELIETTQTSQITTVLIAQVSVDGSYYNRANEREQRNDIQGALQDFNKAIQIDPNEPNYYYRRSQLRYDKFNDRVGGINDMRQAAKLYLQQDSKYYYHAIYHLERMGVTY